MSLPPDSSNLRYLYRADAGVFTDDGGTTPATTDGDSVARWKDQTTNLCDLRSAAAPVLKLAQINGLPSLRFDGTTNYFDFDNTFLGKYRTIYAVVSVADTSTRTLLGGTSVSLEYRFDSLKQRLVNALTADIGFCTTALTANTWAQVNVSWDGSTGLFRTARSADGTVTASPGPPVVGLGATTFMGKLAPAQDFFKGDVAALFEYAVIHDTTTRQSVESWINGIWGV